MDSAACWLGIFLTCDFEDSKVFVFTKRICLPASDAAMLGLAAVPGWIPVKSIIFRRVRRLNRFFDVVMFLASVSRLTFGLDELVCIYNLHGDWTWHM